MQQGRGNVGILNHPVQRPASGTLAWPSTRWSRRWLLNASVRLIYEDPEHGEQFVSSAIGLDLGRVLPFLGGTPKRPNEVIRHASARQQDPAR